MYYLVFFGSIYPYRFIAIRKFLVSIMFFCRAKEPKSVPASTMQACLQIVNERSRFYLKAPAHGAHQSSLPLFRNFPMGNILQSVRSLSLNSYRLPFGCCGTRSVSYALRRI